MGGVLGIIAEYDPFHRGHLYHLEEAKRVTGAELTVCVMSGGFTQRGDPACFDKYLRAEAAIRNGIDLVVELPFVYACNNAEYFARGAVDILGGLGCVDALSFGSESGDMEGLLTVARILAEDGAELNALISDGMGRGWSYPRARAAAVVAAVSGGAGEKPRASSVTRLLSASNDILATEYLRRLISIGSPIEPVAVKRFACAEDGLDAEAGVAGATALRALLAAGEDISAYLPEPTRDVIAEYSRRGVSPVNPETLLALLLWRVITSGPEGLAQIFSATEGLENRLMAAANRASSLKEVVRYTKTRRYTETRVKRLIAHTAVGLTKADMASAAEAGVYARILAFGESGARLLRRIRKTARIPLITNPNKQLADYPSLGPIARMDRRAAAVYRVMQAGALAGYDDAKVHPLKL
jgi:predicted nucleotidyltransferase